MNRAANTVRKEKPPHPTFGEAFRFWLKLGFISFGGPAGQIAIMHEFLVENKRWISESRFMHALNYCMILPGPEAQQLATYIGWLLHGVRGGITAGVLFIFPGLLILLGLSILYVVFGKLAMVSALFYALKPAVIAIILVALIRIGAKSLRTKLHYAVAITSFVLIFFFEVSFPIIVFGAIALGWIAVKVLPGLFPARGSVDLAADESSFLISSLSGEKSKPYTFRQLSIKIGTAVLLWAMPFLIYVLVRADLTFWITLSNFFTKAAFVTFGGAYAVLPYVAQESVEKYHWLTELQMIDGMALGETTPGPLILVLVFVGFMAGYHHTNALLGGAAGLFITAYYTFLPSFLFILIGAPLVERTKDSEQLKQALSIVTAAVVGVILNLTLYFGKSVLYSGGTLQWFPVCWVLVSFLALFRFRINMLAWIVVSAIAGLLFHLMSR